jgi:hypothetical protein
MKKVPNNRVVDHVVSEQRGAAWEAWDTYWELYARAFAQSLQTNDLLSSFVKNPNVTGAYAEAWIRSMVRNMLSHRFRISTGAVIRPCDSIRNQGLSKVPQCDLILWDPSEMPAIFESSEFALVPRFASRAIIEIKRTGSKAERECLAMQLKERQNLLPTMSQMDFVLGVIVNDNDDRQPLFDNEHRPAPNWLEEYWRRNSVPPVTRILCNNEPDTNGIMAFIYFLAQLAAYKTTNA